ncbi:unnamed protein product [Nippostrongylus brasiliensis]|uniref:Uncharacterized protein n=1 Tax=Nippostrongylus brasiliensis TaxID=27835 RepID=A0A0N4Y809_NIPBR|nr:hypothetical protein Q1695_008530 [Nippostrongylus brasiliensis]VDL75914.1 unnamed protein product [Nippostrongylus brasiliensis]
MGQQHTHIRPISRFHDLCGGVFVVVDAGGMCRRDDSAPLPLQIEFKVFAKLPARQWLACSSHSTTVWHARLDCFRIPPLNVPL